MLKMKLEKCRIQNLKTEDTEHDGC